MNTRNGVSTFISVLILMLLAIAGGTVIYGYTIGALGNLVDAPSTGLMALDTARINTTTHDLTAYIRNSGGVDLRIDNAYVDNVLVPDANITLSSSTITQGEIVTVTIHWSSFTTNVNYDIKLVADDNTKIAFTVTAE